MYAVTGLAGVAEAEELCAGEGEVWGSSKGLKPLPNAFVASPPKGRHNPAAARCFSTSRRETWPDLVALLRITKIVKQSANHITPLVLWLAPGDLLCSLLNKTKPVG